MIFLWSFSTFYEISPMLLAVHSASNEKILRALRVLQMLYVPSRLTMIDYILVELKRNDDEAKRVLRAGREKGLAENEEGCEM